MQPESYRSIMCKAILAGIMIGIGGTVYLLADNRYLGSFLFSLGLFTILRYGFALYTGKVGYIPEKKPVYLAEVGVTMAGNVIGTLLTAVMVRFTRIGPAVHEAAVRTMETKLADGIISRLILGLFCGMLMYIAVDNGKTCKQEKRDVSFVCGTVMPVMVFILCGFNHSVADCFYCFAYADASSDAVQCVLYLLTVALGNAFGGMLIPVMKKLAGGHASE